MKSKFLFFIILLFSVSYISAQSTRIKFEHISLEEGLSQSSVTSIVQDEKGFMWFTTIDGLNKYDGYTLKIYYNLDEPGALTDNVLNVLYETNEGENSVLWVGTAGMGLCKYDKIKDNFISVTHNPSDANSLSNNNIKAIYGDNSILWIGTENGLNKWNQDENKWIVYNFTGALNSISNNIITSILPATNGNLWIGTEKGLNYFDTEKETFTVYNKKNGLDNEKIDALFVDENNIIYLGSEKGFTIFDVKKNVFKKYNQSNGLSNNVVTAITKDFENIIWIGTKNGGLNRFDPATEIFNSYLHDPADEYSLSINNILTLYQDKSNILWIGTSLGGINKWNRAADKLAVFRHNPYDSYSLSSNQVRCIFQDSENDIWIGTVDGGLNKWVQEENQFIHFKHNEFDQNSLSNNHVRTIVEIEKGYFWLGTNGGGMDYFNVKTGKCVNYKHDENNPNSLSNDIIWKILIDSKDRFWIATYGGGLNLFNKDNKTFKSYKCIENDETTLSSDQLTCMLEDSKGRVWIGTTKGLNQFFPDDGTAKRYLNDKTNPSSLSNNRIYTIIEDSEGGIWIGTKGGLNRYIEETDNFKRFTTSTHDFPNNVIMGIINDNDGNLWFTTNRGITKFNIKNETARNYDMRDGLQSNEFLAGSFFKTADGEMFFGGINGFNAFNPANIIDNPNIPSLVITGFQISNSEIELDSAISEKKVIYLDYTQTDLTFNFVALDYIFPSKNQYKYMLVGYDEDWVDAKFERSAKYTNLAPKEYIFKVIGSNNDEVWNEKGVEIKIIIKPAFWQTLLFKISVAAFIIFLTALIIWLRIRMLHRQKRILEEQVKIRTKQLRERNIEIEHKNVVLEEQKKEILTQNEILHQQKEEIEAQRDLIQDQKEIAENQRDFITEQKKEIEDSIHYAKRIQTAALPENVYLNNLFKDYFILFKPRNIVSGDFYWAGTRENKLIIVAADCTGHGVPGAFMSMLGIRFLDEIVNDNKIIRPDLILNKLRDNIIKALHQTGEMFEAKDGMDIALCSIDYENQILEYAGAHNPLYYIRNNEVQVYKADDMPIAIYEKMNPFAQHSIKFEKGDCFYIFSDGYPDQFGGPKGKKFMYKKFRELLAEISVKEMKEQKLMLDQTIEEWKQYPDNYGNSCFAQVDDICVIGVRL
jgi:ligand-binding sensor domain-containing protein